MLVADARAAVKKRMDIDTGVTTFDSDIDLFVTEAARRLYPYAQLEVAPQTASVSPSMGEASVNLAGLATPLAGVREVEYSVGDNVWTPAESFSTHADTLMIRDLSSSVTTVRLFGLAKFSLATVYDYLEQAVVYYAVSEFYKFLIGNKRKYNVYMTNGRQAVDNMQDVADYYEQQANVYLSDRATLYGS